MPSSDAASQTMRTFRTARLGPSKAAGSAAGGADAAGGSGGAARALDDEARKVWALGAGVGGDSCCALVKSAGKGVTCEGAGNHFGAGRALAMPAR